MPTSNQSQYRISRAVITSNATGNNTFDVSGIILEIDIFENLDRPYLTGRVSMLDDNSIFDGNRHLQFKGTERLKVFIEVFSLTEDSYIIEKEFVMTNMRSMIKANDRAAMVQFDLCEPIYYIDRFKKFSRSYTGTPVEIINKILTDESLLGDERGLIKLTDDPIQKPIKVVIPYLTPLQAIKWLLNRCTSVNGTPYFMYSTITEDGIFLDSLDNILVQPPFNNQSRYKTAPFVQSVAFTNSAPGWTNPEYQIIKHHVFDNQHSTFKLLDAGAIHSKFSVSDINSNTSLETEYKSNTHFTDLKRKEIVPKQNVFDAFDDYNNQPSMYFHQITSSNVYADYRTYYDENSKSDHRKKVENMATKAFLLENMITAEVPGYNFIAAGAPVSSVASFIFNSNNSSQDTASELTDVIDLEKTGDYMIHSLRYKFVGSEVSVSLYATKLSRNYEVFA